MGYQSSGRQRSLKRFPSRVSYSASVVVCVLIILSVSAVAQAQSEMHDESFVLTLRGGLTSAEDSEFENYSIGGHGGLGLSIGFEAGSLLLELGPHLIYHNIPEEPLRVGTFEQKRSLGAFAATLETKFSPRVEWISRPYFVIGFGIFDLSGGTTLGVGADIKFTRWGKRLLFTEMSYSSFGVDFWRLSAGCRLY